MCTKNLQTKDGHKSQQISINDCFPNEILEEILCRLSLETELGSAKLVCHRWKLIVDEMVGHGITVTNFDSLIKHLPCEDGKLTQIPTSVKNVASLEEYPNLALRDLTVGVPGMLINDSLTPVIERIAKELLPFPRLAYPHVLKSLSWFEPVPQNLVSVLGSLSSLKSLNISILSLANLTFSGGFQNPCFLRSLTTLIISEVPSYPEFNSTSAILPLNDFLTHCKAPNLICLEITYPIQSLMEVEGDSTRSLINFIKKLPCLKRLCIGVCSPNQNFSPPSKLFQYPRHLLEEMEELGKRIKLESVELMDNHLHSLRPSVQTKAWIVFIKQQSQLRSLKLHLKSSIQFVEDVAVTLQRNANSLVTLDLSCFPCEIGDTGDVYFVPIDGRTLAECSHLKTLKLSDKTINTISFPSFLNYIYVDAMLTNLDVHNILVSENRNLERVELKDSRGGAPKGFGYGVTVNTLREFVKSGRVQRLTIYAGSTDEKFPLEGIPNGNMGNPQRLRKRKVESLFNILTHQSEGNHPEDQIRIDWQLNAQGYYENVGHPSSSDDENNETKANASHLHHPLFKCANLLSSFH